jgi:predicted cobalt transporter CbtA
MARTYLVRGMLVGLLASVVAFGFAKTMGEPQISKAEKFEEQLAQQHGEPEEAPIVSRDVQDTVGLGTGLVLAGTALGGLFGLAFAFVYRRWTSRSARATAGILGAIAFIATYLVPFLKYPPNPPSVGQPDTISRRTTLYLLCVGISIVLVVVAALVRDQLMPRLGAWNATIAAVAAYVVGVAVMYIVLPGIDEVPAGFPNIVLWRFRLASLGIQLLLWTVIGLLFGALTERSERHEAERRDLDAPAPQPSSV